MESDYDFSIVVIGMSGSGKSALLNALKNFLENRSPENFIDAFDSNSRLIDADSKLKSEIVVSQYNGKKYLLIDTPGLCDTSGNITSKDENARIILNSLKTLKYINAIIYVNNSTLCKVTKDFREAALLMLKFLVADVRKITYSVFTFCSNQLFNEDEEDLESDVIRIKEILNLKTCVQNIVKINNIFFSLSKQKILDNLKAVTSKWNTFKEDKLTTIVQMIEKDKVETNQYELFGKLNNTIKKKIMKCSMTYYNMNIKNHERPQNFETEEQKVIKKLIKTPGIKNYYCNGCKANCYENIGVMGKIKGGLKKVFISKSKCKICKCTNALHVIGSNAYYEVIQDLNQIRTNNEIEINISSEALSDLIFKTSESISEIEKIVPEFSPRIILSEIKSSIIEETQQKETTSADFLKCVIIIIDQIQNNLNH